MILFITQRKKRKKATTTFFYSSAHSEFIKKVKKFCAAYREMLGADGKLNPVTLVWWQKNYDGLVDKSEVVLTPNNPLGTITDQKQLEERIAGSVVVEE